MSHKLPKLLNAYDSSGVRPSFTFYSERRKSVLDYIFFSECHLRCTEVLEVWDVDAVDAAGGLPNPDNPSDHVPLMAKFSFVQKLLEKRNLSPELQIRTSMHPGVETDMETLIKVSRILHLDDIELYFVEDNDDGPFSPRNELLSLNAVFSSINCAVSDAKSDGKKALQEIILKKMDEFSCQYSDNEAIIEYDKYGEELLEWGNSHGMTAKLKISRRPGTGRGAEASENIGVGDIVLEFPNCLVISEDYVRNSTMTQDEGRTKVRRSLTPSTMQLALQRILPFPCKKQYTVVFLMPQQSRLKFLKSLLVRMSSGYSRDAKILAGVAGAVVVAQSLWRYSRSTLNS